jgi:hypothetical protein
MSNLYTYQVLKDTTEHAVIKLTAKFDGTGQEDNHYRIPANTLAGALATNGYPVANVWGGAANTPLSYYGLTVHRVWYDCATGGDVQLFWHADTAVSMMFLNGNGEYDGAGNWITIPNNAKGTANCIGDIGIQTRGMAANDSYTIIVELRKENEYYSRGQFRDPAAFNYKPYGLTPGPNGA